MGVFNYQSLLLRERERETRGMGECGRANRAALIATFPNQEGPELRGDITQETHQKQTERRPLTIGRSRADAKGEGGVCRGQVARTPLSLANWGAVAVHWRGVGEVRSGGEGEGQRMSE